MNRLEACRALGRLLSRPAAGTLAALAERQWDVLLAAANDACLAPALYRSLADADLLRAVPDDVEAYLAALHALNLQRNHRLREQGRALVAALNARGVEPLLLKGIASLLCEPGAMARRMVADIDLVVPLPAAEAAGCVLRALGYTRLAGRDRAPHALGDFARADAVGAVDLHHELLAEARLLPSAEVWARSQSLERDGARFRVPAPTDRLLHLLLHDLIQDHGYFDGALNLRHLHDAASQISAGAAIDWDRVRGALAPHGLVAALDVWRLALGDLFAVELPARRASPLAGVLYARARLRLRYPALERAFEILGNVHRSVASYRFAPHNGRFPRLRRAGVYLWVNRARTLERAVHILLYRRS